MVFALYGLDDKQRAMITAAGGGKYSLAYLLVVCVKSQSLTLLKLLCENFETELKEAFRFCEGLQVPQKQYEGKIIYPNMAKEFIAYLDMQGFFTNQKCFILSDNIKDKNRLLYLTAILNSKTNFWYFKQIGATLGASGYEMSKIFVEKLPVVETNKIDSKLLAEIEGLAKEILEINHACHSEACLQAKESHTKLKRDVSPSPQHDKIKNCHSEVLQSKTEESHNPPPSPLRNGRGDYSADTSKLESRLDSLIYQAYNLNQDEIALIESAFNSAGGGA
ncbi:hypothetical protein CQA66_08990 [Helicobacter aurati]|uniref:site-specific DNA-methyltransferase (adenine-specific) n=2 Tax=Helicobacter aurati TaxID=137778 RepID=A0A3D8IWJ0_9HELI|nr:hypothetical protein CQA66_08990 [Helicobacter aurati]